MIAGNLDQIVMKLFVQLYSFLCLALIDLIQDLLQPFSDLLFSIFRCQKEGADLYKSPKLTDLHIIAFLGKKQHGKETAQTLAHMIHKKISLALTAFQQSHIFQSP